ncbi:MAG TPA: MFS transporter [Gemmatimonadaceae bacterium]|nr:MFS transporter [Gemmatimonadaceae bacterium]
MSAKAGRREWIGLAVIALPCLLYSMDLTVLHLAVPKISAALEPSSAQLLWIIDVYGFFVAGSLITLGTLGDRIGRRKLLLIGAALFGLASVLAAFSKSAEMLIVNRAVLGVAGATIAPSTMSLIRNMFNDPHERRTAISIWIISFSLGGAIGPVVGGALLQYFWWGSAFLMGVPVMVLVLIAGPMLLPEYKDPNAGKLDLISAAMSLTAVLGVIYGVKRIAQDAVGTSSIAPVALVVPLLFILMGLAIGWLFVRRQLHLEDPLIDLRLFRLPGFRAALVLYGGAIFLQFGGFLFLAQYLQLVLGLSPLEGGLWSVPWAIGFIAGSLVTPPLSRRIAPVHLIFWGLVVSSLGYFLFARLGPTRADLPMFALASLILSFGSSPVFTLANDVIIGSAPPERAGAASGISETCAEMGGALGVAIFGSIGVAIYRGMLTQALPDGVTPEMSRNALATLAGALDVSRQLQTVATATLTQAARGAFLRGLVVCEVISGVGTLALAFFARARFREAAPVVQGIASHAA